MTPGLQPIAKALNAWLSRPVLSGTHAVVWGLVKLMALSCLLSYLFINFFDGDYHVANRLFSIQNYGFTRLFIYGCGLVVSGLLAFAYRAYEYNCAEGFFLSAAHIGILLAAAVARTGSLIGTLVILLILAGFSYFFAYPRIACRFGKKATVSELPILSLIACTLISCAFLPTTSTLAERSEQYSQLEQASSYTTEPVAYVDVEAVQETLTPLAARWGSLSTEEKLEGLTVVARYECANILGCPLPTLEVRDLGTGVRGAYLLPSEIIALDTALLDSSAEETLVTLLHECRHAYQHASQVAVEALSYTYPELLDLYYLRDATQLASANRGYDAGSYNSEQEAYYNHPYEGDSFTYAATRMNAYLSTLQVSEEERTLFLRDYLESALSPEEIEQLLCSTALLEEL